MRTFRVPRAARLATGLAATVVAGVTAAAFWSGGWSWTTVVLLAMTLFGVLGVLDVQTARVELHDDRLVTVGNLRRHVYARQQLTQVTWAKGSPVSMRSSSGEWIHLPGVGPGGQALVNTLRAWLKGSQLADN